MVGILGNMIMKIMGYEDRSMIANYAHFSTKHINEFQEKGTSTYLPSEPEYRRFSIAFFC